MSNYWEKIFNDVCAIEDSHGLTTQVRGGGMSNVRKHAKHVEKKDDYKKIVLDTVLDTKCSKCKNNKFYPIFNPLLRIDSLNADASDTFVGYFYFKCGFGTVEELSERINNNEDFAKFLESNKCELGSVIDDFGLFVGLENNLVDLPKQLKKGGAKKTSKKTSKKSSKKTLKKTSKKVKKDSKKTSKKTSKKVKKSSKKSQKI